MENTVCPSGADNCLCLGKPRRLELQRTAAGGLLSICRAWASAHRGQWRERVLLADDQFLMLMGDVAFNVTHVYQVGQNALDFVNVHIFYVHELQSNQKGI